MDTILSSRFRFEEKEFSSAAPEWRNVAPGINILGTCRNRCRAKYDVVIVQKGFYDQQEARVGLTTK